MTRKLSRAVLFAAAALALVSSGRAFTADEKKDDKKYTIEDIMKLGHNKTKGLVKVIGDEVKAEKWDAAKKDATVLKGFGEALVALKPAKGDDASWEKLTGKYKTSTAAVATAVEKKDAKGTAAALGAIGKSCKECHDAHKE